MSRAIIFGGMSAEAQTPSPELKVLDRFVGSWRLEVVSGQANGDQEKSTLACVFKWSLQGQYIEARLTDLDGKQIALSLYSYDSDAGVHKMWTFAPNSPKPTLSTLRWNELKKTFTGKGDLGNGITEQSTGRFIGNDRIEWTGTTNNASGNVLGEFKANYLRQK